MQAAGPRVQPAPFFAPGMSREVLPALSSFAECWVSCCSS